jgi:hypothetical protein
MSRHAGVLIATMTKPPTLASAPADRPSALGPRFCNALARANRGALAAREF